MQVLGPACHVPEKLLTLLSCQDATALKTMANGVDIPLPFKQVLIAARAVSASFSKLRLLLPISPSLFLQCIIPLFTVSSSCNEMPTWVLAHRRTLRVSVRWISLYCRLAWKVISIKRCLWSPEEAFLLGSILPLSFSYSGGCDQDFKKCINK